MLIPNHEFDNYRFLGTNLYGGTIEGVRLLNTITKSSSNSLEEASMLIVLTDGEPTSGEKLREKYVIRK